MIETSRRMFLQGAGGALLSLPLLTSLLPRSARAAAAARPLRYIQIGNPYGPTDETWFGKMNHTQRFAPNVRYQALSDIAGPLSRIVGPAFDPYRAKFSVLRGLDVMVETPNHNYCFTTCASGYASGLDGDEYAPMSGQESLDVLLSKSSKVYPNAVAASRRLVTLNPITTCDYSRNRSFSWAKGSNGPQIVRPIKQTQAFYDAFASGFESAQAMDAREQRLMNAVHGDYKKVRDGGRLSSADKQKLESYMSLISDIERDLATISTCQPPQREAEPDVEATCRNQLRILAATLACDMTRVASIMYGMSAPYSTRQPIGDGGRHPPDSRRHDRDRKACGHPARLARRSE
jgi:Protein of unknown function (DUF1552)